MTRIRPADLGDLGWLLKQLRAFDEFFGSKRSLFPDSNEEAVAMLEQLVTTQPFFIAEDFSGHVGFIAGSLSLHPFNTSIRVLSELFWWVDPRYRGSSAGARLLEYFIAYGKQNADWVVMTLEAKSPVDPRSLLRKGFAHYESSFLMEVS
jgi:N-acetylglutamate synthase-like GNAT family acetyltransferase